MLSNSFVFADDTETALFKNFTEIIVSKPSDGHYISSTLDSFFGAIMPIKLNIHPSDFKSQYFSFIETALLYIFILILQNLFKTNRRTLLHTITFGFCASAALFFIQTQPMMLFIYDGFFRMLLPVFLFISLFSLLINNINNYSRKHLFFIFLLTFISAISNELIAFSTFIGFITYFLLSKIQRKPDEKIQTILIHILYSFFGIIVMLWAGAFTRKNDLEIQNIQYFINIIQSVPEFSKEYIKYIIVQYIPAYFLLICQFLFLYFKTNRDKKVIETAQLMLCFLFGFLIFFYLLIFLGKTYYWPGKYWVIHPDLHVMYKLILFSFNIVFFNIIYKYKFLKEKMISFIFIIVTIILCFKNYNFYAVFLQDRIIPLKMETYKAEKIIRLASLQHRNALLDNRIGEDGYLWALHKNVQNYTADLYINNISYISYLKNIEENSEMQNFVIFTDSDTANNDFNKNGGIFTEEEIRNINFTRLRDKRFLLNKK